MDYLRHFRALLPFILAAVIFWLADSLILTISSGNGFLVCLWDGVTSTRLIFRLVIALLILLIGFTKVLRREMDYKMCIRDSHMARWRSGLTHQPFTLAFRGSNPLRVTKMLL